MILYYPPGPHNSFHKNNKIITTTVIISIILCNNIIIIIVIRTMCPTIWYLHQQDWVPVTHPALPPPASLPGPLLDILWRMVGATLWQTPSISWQSVSSWDKSLASVPIPAALATSHVGLFPLLARKHTTRAEVPRVLAQAWTHSRFSINVGPTWPPPTLPTSQADPQMSL